MASHASPAARSETARGIVHTHSTTSRPRPSFCTMVAIRRASPTWTGTAASVRRKVFRTAAVKLRSPTMRR